MAVFGEVTPFMVNHIDGKSMDRPVYTDWCRRMYHYKTEDFIQRRPFDPDEMVRPISKDEAMLAMEDLLTEAKVKMLYHHTLFQVMMKDG